MVCLARVGGGEFLAGGEEWLAWRRTWADGLSEWGTWWQMPVRLSWLAGCCRLRPVVGDGVRVDVVGRWLLPVVVTDLAEGGCLAWGEERGVSSPVARSGGHGGRFRLGWDDSLGGKLGRVGW